MSKDKFIDDTPNKPSAGPVQVHDEKGNASHPSSGLVAHPDKAAHDQNTSRNRRVSIIRTVLRPQSVSKF